MLYRIRHWMLRRKWGERAQRTPFKAIYDSSIIPRNNLVLKQDFLVVDCEMSGLDVNTSELLSIGWVRIVKGRIDYGSRKHLLIHSSESVGDSIKIHGLCDQRLAGASDASKVLSLLAHQIESAVLVFHHAVLDIAFLQKSALKAFGCPLMFSYVDTMSIEQRRLERQSKTGGLQLNICRDRYGLPVAIEHNAMFDAVATAELFLAQCANMGSAASNASAPSKGELNVNKSHLKLSDLSVSLS